MTTKITAMALPFFLFLCLEARCELSLALNYLAHDKNTILMNEMTAGNLSDQHVWENLKSSLSDSTNLLKNLFRRITDSLKSFLKEHTHEGMANTNDETKDILVH